jgi:hypothetical protein
MDGTMKLHEQDCQPLTESAAGCQFRLLRFCLIVGGDYHCRVLDISRSNARS